MALYDDCLTGTGRTYLQCVCDDLHRQFDQAVTLLIKRVSGELIAFSGHQNHTSNHDLRSYCIRLSRIYAENPQDITNLAMLDSFTIQNKLGVLKSYVFGNGEQESDALLICSPNNELGSFSAQIDYLQAIEARCLTELSRLEIDDLLQRFQFAAEASDAYLWEITPSGHYTYLSPQAEKVKGHPIASLIGQSPYTHMSPEHEEDIREEVQEAIDNKSSFTLTHSTVKSDGTVTWEEIKGIVKFDDAGDVIGLYGLGICIDQRIRSWQDMQLAASVFESNECIIILDSEFQVKRVNQATMTTLDMPLGQLLNRQIDFLHATYENGKGFIIGNLSELKLSGYWQGDLVLTHYKTGEFNARMSVTTVNDYKNDVSHYILTFADITAQKRTQADIQKEVALKSTALAETQQKLMEKEKMAALGGLVVGVAHEINTPIGICQTASSNLTDILKMLREMVTNGKLSQKKFLSMLQEMEESSQLVDNNLTRAGELINSFKLIAVDQSDNDFKTIDIKAHLDIIVSTVMAPFEDRNIEVVTSGEEGAMLTLDVGAFTQVMINLLNNAFIHGFEHQDDGRVDIRFKAVRKGYEFMVRDNGRGIPSDNIGKLVEPFYTTKRGAGSSGLGLHAVYNVVTQRFHSHLHIKSELDEYTEMSFYIEDVPG